MNAARVFVDTNILLRGMLSQMDKHQTASHRLLALRAAGSELWISPQVIREYLVQVTHPRTFVPPLPIEAIARQVNEIQTLFFIAEETVAVVVRLMQLLKEQPTRGKQIHDANIVATMLTYGIGTLLTLNVEDMKRFSEKVEVITL